MRKAVLFIAMSLDGYIADERGGVEWLDGHDPDTENIDAYSEFVQNADTVIMGWNTYHQIVTELSPLEWVYGNLTSYVITHRKLPPKDNIFFTDKDPAELITELKSRDGKNIWICGGASLVGQLADLIDEYQISVIPTILGKGKRLFDTVQDEVKLKLLSTRNYKGIVELVYSRR